MYKDYKVVVNTAAGRRRYMKYLIPYVLSSSVVDRYDIWINTHNSADIEFFKRLAEQFEKINLVWQPDGVVNGNKTINAFYKQCTEENTIYFKLDDDIVWMEEDLIEKMVKFRVDNPDLYNNQKSSGITISTTNNNTNNNSNNITLNMSVDEIKENISDNTYLSDSDKQELLDKLNEIIELQNSTESKSKKWSKAKTILAFLLDKGADIAIMYIPQILSAITK